MKKWLILVKCLIIFLLIGFIGFYLFGLSEIFYPLQTLIILYVLQWLAVLIIFMTPRHGDEAKISWVIFVLGIPVVGIVGYFLFGRAYSSAKKAKDARKKLNHFCIEEDDHDHRSASLKYGTRMVLSNYLHNISGRPLYAGTNAEFLIDGPKFKNELIQELKSAKKHILMEYYIWHTSSFADEVKEVLLEKAKQGVEIKIIADDLGTVKLKWSYIKELRRAGIRFELFQSIHFHNISKNQNSRTHRKICVIDGRVAFTGGHNIGDEYLHKSKKYGYWADTSLKITGKAVKSAILIFFTNWNKVTKEMLKLSDYLDVEACGTSENQIIEGNQCIKTKGYMQLVEDGPATIDAIHQNALVKMISQATKRIWITTPYLVPPGDVIAALKMAAQSGVDVRIITPALADKKSMFKVTRSYYEGLIDCGVKIYEYYNDGPRFMHSKTIVCDDDMAALGTTNVDMRSFRLNFEVMAYMYEMDVVKDISNYFDFILSTSKLVDTQYMQENKIHRNRLTVAILRIFSPLM